ncbi:MAG: glutamate-5-semialdehyde dehydrogenase [Clostridia bacterium]|nr:glutamate-5-semialdehyde dehydrogenase [Clostridia bacterium]
MRNTQDILKAAKAASPYITAASPATLDSALTAAAIELEASAAEILAANLEDLKAAEGKISPVMLDRLRLTKERIADMAEGIRGVVALPSPLGKILEENKRPNGLTVRKISVSMGVIAIIYESRPNVTSDAAALALKAGSACVLRGGKEAFRSSMAIVAAIKRGIVKAGLPADAVNLVEDTTRDSAMELMKADSYIDLLIPRGGAGLIRSVIENATVPCIRTGTGICHIYVDKSADIPMALDVIENAKTSRPSVCNAEEVLLCHKDIASELLPRLYDRLVTSRAASGLTPVELRTDERAHAIIGGVKAGKTDFDTEFLDYILAVGVVDSIEDAVAHIAKHSTGHSEAILTTDETAADYFAKTVDSAAVYINASTRFTDGGEFGFGCEMGISTQKLHARGPMGLPELTTYKYIITGNGQTR